MNKTANNMITQFKAAYKLLATALPAPEAFKVVLSLFIVHFLFNSAKSRIRSELDKTSNKTEFPSRNLFEHADGLLSAINKEGSEAIELSSYGEKLDEAVQKELVGIISGVDIVDAQSSNLYGLLDIEELKEVLPDRFAEYSPLSLTKLLNALLLLESGSFRDRFNSVDREMVYDNYGHDIVKFSSPGLSAIVNAALEYYFNWAANPRSNINDDLSYTVYLEEEANRAENDTIIFNPIDLLHGLGEDEKYDFFFKELQSELSILSATGKMAIVLPYEYINSEGLIRQILQERVYSDTVAAVIQLPDKLYESKYIGATFLILISKNKKENFKEKIAFIRPNYEISNDISDREIGVISEYCDRLKANWTESAVIDNKDASIDLTPSCHIASLSSELNAPSFNGMALRSLCTIKKGSVLAGLNSKDLSPHIWDMYFYKRHARTGMFDMRWDETRMARSSSIWRKQLDIARCLLLSLTSELKLNKMSEIDQRVEIFDPEKLGRERVPIGTDIWKLVPGDNSNDIKYLYFQLHSPIVKKQIERIVNQPERKNPGLTKKELGSLIIPVTDLDQQQGYVADKLREAIELKELRDREERERLASTLGVNIQAITQDSERKIAQFITHNVAPKIPQIMGPIDRTIDFIAKQEQDLTESNIPTVANDWDNAKKALLKAQESVKQIRNIIDVTEKYINRQISKEDFQPADLYKMLDDIRRLSDIEINITSTLSSKVLLHEAGFKEAINNLIENAKKYAFDPGQKDAQLMFALSEDERDVIIDYRNNGRPFPPNISKNRFLNIGKKSGSKGGLGLGGAWLGKVLTAHRGSLEIIRDANPLHFVIRLPKEMGNEISQA